MYISNGKRIDDPNFGTANQTNTNAVMSSITGDGTSNTITITNDVQRFKINDVVVFRKTNDGPSPMIPDSYDTVLSGGDLQFSTAKGINPEEIIIDGDGFVTSTTSKKGPEEQVPGQVLDTVDIKVFLN